MVEMWSAKKFMKAVIFNITCDYLKLVAIK